MAAGTSSGNFCAGLQRACAAPVSFFVIVFLAIAPNAGWAQTAPPAPLPQAAQEALDKGIIAAKVPDYPLAIRYFEDARKIAPAAPVVFMNLGIAESKMPGRELRAIVWFGAYLTALPDAPNAAAVREQIALLEVMNQSNVSRLIKSMQDAAREFSGLKKRDALRKVVELWAKAGNVTAALQAADLSENDDRSDNYYAIAKIQAESGDIAGAQKTASLIQKATDRERAQSTIAEVRERNRIASSANQSGVAVSSWLEELGIYNAYGSRPASVQPRYLNTAIFLDVAGHLKDLNSSLKSKLAREEEQDKIFRRTGPQILFDGLNDTAAEMVDRHNTIIKMLKPLKKQ